MSPNLRLFQGNNVLRVGTQLAIADDCCCDVYNPYRWCAGCQDGVFIRNFAGTTDIDDAPDLILTEVFYEITGYPELLSFPLTPAHLPPPYQGYPWEPGVGAIRILAYKDARVGNFSWLAPVNHIVNTGTPNNATVIGTVTMRDSVENFRGNDPANLRYRYFCPPCPPDTINQPTIPSDCTFGVFNYPHFIACQFDPFLFGYATQDCCCERESTLTVDSDDCGSLRFSWSCFAPNTMMGGFAPAPISFVDNRTPFGPFVGNRCGPVSVSRTFSTQANDPFLTDKCFMCGDGGALSFFTVTITATPTYEPK